MKRTTDQMDEKDWIIVRLLSVIEHSVCTIPATSFADYYRTLAWCDDNVIAMYRAMRTIHTEQGIADWPYTVLDEPLPLECQLVGDEV
jgi:hypothetical protein